MQKQIHTRDVKLITMGKSKGICLPQKILKRYGFSDSLLLVETPKGVLLRKKIVSNGDKKLSWEDSYREMAAEQENWDDFDITLQDGISGE